MLGTFDLVFFVPEAILLTLAVAGTRSRAPWSTVSAAGPHAWIANGFATSITSRDRFFDSPASLFSPWSSGRGGSRT